MANDYAFVTNNERPTLRERVNALAQHRPLYGSIDKHPQSGIYNRFGENWPMVLYYVEGEVHRCKDAVDVFIFKQAQSLTEAELETGLAMVMEKLMSAQFLHGKVVKVMKEMALAQAPMKEFMDDFRVDSKYNSEIRRAANGEMLSCYGSKGEPVPEWCATIGPQNLDPAQYAVRHWLLDPLFAFISTPFQSILLNIPKIRKRSDKAKRDIRVFSENTVTALAGTVMIMVAILCATAAIFTLDVVKKRQIRILIMAIYAMAFALPMQLLGPSSLPLYTLVISFFQAMVMFVGTTDDEE